MSITVYNISGSPMGWRVLLGLEFKGLDYNARYLKGSEQEHKQHPFLQMNPHGKVPVLEHNGFYIRESLAILGWLDEQFADRPLFGNTVDDVRSVWRSVARVSDYLLKATSGVVFPVFGGENGAPKTDDVTTAQLRHAALVLKVELRELDRTLTKSGFLCGETVTAADAVAFPEVGRIMRALATKPTSMDALGFGSFDQDFPNISAWRDRVTSQPGYARTVPPHWSED